jgi:ubiquinone/menaquinone biosynthesis C-methylase UbiE
VLEVGCGGGLLGNYLNNFCRYVGTDYSEQMVKKTIELNRFSALQCEANNLIFKDKTFDHAFVFSVFQYFPSDDYARQVIAELKRVAIKTVCVSDIPTESHDPDHHIYDEAFFAGWEITAGLYARQHRRFTAILRL